MEKRRVAMTLEQLWHRVPGGTAVAALGMARHLKDLPGIELVGVAARHPKQPPAEWASPVEVFELPLPRAALYRTWHKWRRPRVQLATGPVDVIHATSAATPPKSAPLVMTVHDLAWQHDESHFTPRGLTFFRRGLEVALRDVDLVLCPSRATALDCEKAGWSPDRIRVIPLGTDATLARDATIASTRARYSLERDYVLWTGTIEPRKNLARLLEAYRSLDADVDLVLCGPRGWNEDLDALIAPVKERVRILGFVPRDDLAALYAGARAFCWPSLREGFGFPVLEAMAQGTPVVTSRGTSTEEIAGEAAVLVDPHDPADIASGIERILGDDALHARLSEAGSARAREFTWERTARAVADAYEEVSQRT
ncbi:MAG TPA: glycosyltransferase family 1 protein [Actinomycetota bacterium]|jgi:glycosyltransferase involved in cell wall biosynthesis